MHTGEPHDRHPAHGVPDEDHWRAADKLLHHLIEIISELWNPAALRLGTARSAMRTLVVEHLPQLATKVETLEVPAVHVQPIAMDVEQRYVLRGALVHLRMQHDPVWRGDIRAVGPKREEFPEIFHRVTHDPLRDDPALEFDAQCDTPGGERGDAGNQPEPRGGLAAF